jgi:hypothetical protein
VCALEEVEVEGEVEVEVEATGSVEAMEAVWGTRGFVLREFDGSGPRSFRQSSGLFALRPQGDKAQGSIAGTVGAREEESGAVRFVYRSGCCRADLV